MRNWLLNLRRHLRLVDDSLDHVHYQTLVNWGSEKAFLPKKWNYVGCEGDFISSFKLYFKRKVDLQKRKILLLSLY